MGSPKISLNFTDNFTHFTVLIIATFLICGLTLFIASSYPFVLTLMFSFSLKCPFFFDVYSLDIFIENSNIPSLSSFCKTWKGKFSSRVSGAIKSSFCYSSNNFFAPHSGWFNLSWLWISRDFSVEEHYCWHDWKFSTSNIHVYLLVRN